MAGTYPDRTFFWLWGQGSPPPRTALLTRAFISGKVVVTLFVALVYYSYLLAPDWMWMYFVKASDLPGWMVWYVLIGYFFAYGIGFVLKTEGEKIFRGYPIFLIFLMLAAEGLLIYLLKDRYLSVGTIEQFQAGQGTPLTEFAVGQLPATLTALLIPISLGLIWWSRRQS